jgi:hypothetical protein
MWPEACTCFSCFGTASRRDFLQGGPIPSPRTLMPTHFRLQSFFLGASLLLLAGAFFGSTLEAQNPNPPPPGVLPAPPPGVPPAMHDRGNVPPPWLGDPPKGQPGSVPGNVNRAAFASEAQSLTLAMTNGVVPGPDGAYLPIPAQRSVLGALRGLEGHGALGQRLAPENNAHAATEAAVLAETIHGLLSNADNLHEVAAAFNALIDASSEEFLEHPPAELLVIHAALTRLIGAAATES